MRPFAALDPGDLGDLSGDRLGSLPRGDADIACVGSRRLAASRKDSQNAPIATLGMRGRSTAGNSPFSQPREALGAS